MISHDSNWTEPHKPSSQASPKPSILKGKVYQLTLFKLPSLSATELETFSFSFPSKCMNYWQEAKDKIWVTRLSWPREISCSPVGKVNTLSAQLLQSFSGSQDQISAFQQKLNPQSLPGLGGKGWTLGEWEIGGERQWFPRWLAVQ